jgi:hypothetical protein
VKWLYVARIRDQVVGFCDHDSKHFASFKIKFLEELNYYQLLNYSSTLLHEAVVVEIRCLYSKKGFRKRTQTLIIIF